MSEVDAAATEPGCHGPLCFLVKREEVRQNGDFQPVLGLSTTPHTHITKGREVRGLGGIGRITALESEGYEIGSR
ncbi:hypothetical protein BST61_g3146 [Cercospora zeina]